MSSTRADKINVRHVPLLCVCTQQTLPEVNLAQRRRHRGMATMVENPFSPSARQTNTTPNVRGMWCMLYFTMHAVHIYTYIPKQRSERIN